MKSSILKGGFENDEASTIVFSFAGQGAGGVVGFEWVNFFKDRPVKVVCIKDTHKAYYMGALYGEDGSTISKGVDSHVELFRSIIEESKCDNVVMTGSSLGGYAAALYGVLLNADYTLPYSSQTFIKNHPKYGRNERPHLAKWAYRYASEEDQERYFDLTELDYDNFTGKIHYHWSRSWRDTRYVNHISEFCKTYPRNKYDGDFEQDDAIDFRVHGTIKLHAKLCKKLKDWGYLAKHFERVIK
jgi:hypothetical protein